MITDIIVTYNDEKQIEKLKKETLKGSPSIVFYNEQSRLERKKAFLLKNHWAAYATPFALCMDGDKPVKCFYSETGEDIIKSLINYVNEQNIYS